MEYDSENLNSEEIYSSLRGVTEAIQNYSFRSQEDLMEPLRRDAGGAVPFESDPRTGGDTVEGGRTALDNKTSLLNTPSARSFTGPRFRDYNPCNYTDGPGSLDKTALYEDGVDPRRDGGAPFTFRFCSLYRFCKALTFLRLSVQHAVRSAWRTRS